MNPESSVVTISIMMSDRMSHVYILINFQLEIQVQSTRLKLPENKAPGLNRVDIIWS